jgi:uncharacterized phage protein (TIGR01671 family)
MREIKFRCFDERNKEMRYSDRHDGEFYINAKGVLYMYAIPKSEGYIGDTQYYKSYKVMQFTGLLDKKGIDIYSNDVIKLFDEEFEIDEVQEVVFKTGMFCVKTENEYVPLYQVSQICEVIGNIHEHPELLC